MAGTVIKARLRALVRSKDTLWFTPQNMMKLGDMSDGLPTMYLAKTARRSVGIDFPSL